MQLGIIENFKQIPNYNRQINKHWMFMLLQLVNFYIPKHKFYYQSE